MKPITVTSPLLPPLEDFTASLEDIWKLKWLTNNGTYHQQLEQALCEYLGVEYISLFSNGTLALVIALQALELEGEVITTPYSFVATSHALLLNKLKPVFVDVDPDTLNLDPAKVEAAITDKTVGILPVHVYGTPCDHSRLQQIADKHNLKIIYDAAHAFGVEEKGYSVLNYGDLSILSFHATKAYSTIEGGAVICHTKEMKEKLDKLKSFGFDSDIEVSLIAHNAKMNEVQAAFGLATLNIIDDAIAQRKFVANEYRSQLRGVKGISFPRELPDVKYNYSYFPVFIDEQEYGESRDSLFSKLKNSNVLARRYFYPVITDYAAYKNNPEIEVVSDEISRGISKKVICLPLHHELSIDDINKIVEICKSENKK